MNKKCIQRLWGEAGLKAPAKKVHKRRRLTGTSENGCTRRRAQYIGHVWSYDFAMDATEDGRRVKVMPIVDEYSRECLALEMERSITAEDVVEVLDRLFSERGEPAYIRSDNGPEFIAKAIKGWRLPESRPFTQSRVLRGRTLTQRPSSAGYGTSYWIGRCLSI